MPPTCEKDFSRFEKRTHDGKGGAKLPENRKEKKNQLCLMLKEQCFGGGALRKDELREENKEKGSAKEINT